MALGRLRLLREGWRLRLGRDEGAMSGMADALESKRQMVRQHPTSELARFSLGKALFDRGELAEASEHLRVALERKPDWMVVQILLGKCALGMGDRAAARAALERAHSPTDEAETQPGTA